MISIILEYDIDHISGTYSNTILRRKQNYCILKMASKIRSTDTCYHCGDTCVAESIRYNGHLFCCSGCQAVYELLENNGLCQYYSLADNAGINPTKQPENQKWQFLDDEKMADKLISFKSSALHIVSFYIPGMHCSSCIYLLENLSRIAPGVISSEVNFLKKEFLVKYNPGDISLRKIVEVLSRIGYAPLISLNDAEKDHSILHDKQIYYKIGIAGFCFGNIMILSLPEYFDFKNLLSDSFIDMFRYLNMLLIIPVLAFSAKDYFRSAWNAIQSLRANMDFAVALGIAGLAIQSFYDVLSGTGSGYFDSLSGLVFFLLTGKFIQQRTYESLSFDRDYKSYFPLAITRVKGREEKSINVNDLMVNDQILVHHEELIPADSILESGNALIDYSFVTGESKPVYCQSGDLIYAGGRNKGINLRLYVVNTVSQSYLTRLWNDKNFEKEKESGLSLWSTQIANWFTVAVITIAIGTAIYWKINNPSLLMRAVTSVLIVACPCVMALSIPFTFGQIMRILGKNGFYLKNGQSIEKLASIQSIVFDKTGTLTEETASELDKSHNLTLKEKEWLYTAASQSMHPVSRGIKEQLDGLDVFPISNWEETIGKGISTTIDGNEIKIGTIDYVSGGRQVSQISKAPGKTFIAMNGQVRASITAHQELRKDIKELSGTLRKKFKLFILSGDGDGQRDELKKYFSAHNLFFSQSPCDKLTFIETLKQNGNKVMMIGDGLNDAGALKASNFGITVTNDVNSFTPASDAILDIKKLGLLPNFSGLARDTKKIVFGALVFSLLYNFIGLSYAVRGELQPWVAAILMPVSSITVVLYTRIATLIAARKNNL
jgi:P-type Cu+ transporter